MAGWKVRPLTEDMMASIAEEYNRGLEFVALKGKYRVGAAKISQAVHRFGRKPRKKPRTGPTDQTRRIYEAYRGRGSGRAALEAVAAEFGVSVHTVYRSVGVIEGRILDYDRSRRARQYDTRKERIASQRRADAEESRARIHLPRHPTEMSP